MDLLQAQEAVPVRLLLQLPRVLSLGSLSSRIRAVYSLPEPPLRSGLGHEGESQEGNRSSLVGLAPRRELPDGRPGDPLVALPDRRLGPVGVSVGAVPRGAPQARPGRRRAPRAEGPGSGNSPPASQQLVRLDERGRGRRPKDTGGGGGQNLCGHGTEAGGGQDLSQHHQERVVPNQEDEEAGQRGLLAGGGQPPGRGEGRPRLAESRGGAPPDVGLRRTRRAAPVVPPRRPGERAPVEVGSRGPGRRGRPGAGESGKVVPRRGTERNALQALGEEEEDGRVQGRASFRGLCLRLSRGDPAVRRDPGPVRRELLLPDPSQDAVPEGREVDRRSCRCRLRCGRRRRTRHLPAKHFSPITLD